MEKAGLAKQKMPKGKFYCYDIKYGLLKDLDGVKFDYIVSSMEKEKIKLRKEKETLLIPLYCKALESKKETPIIIDNKAVELVSRIEYDYVQLKIPKQTHVTICIRAKQFDNYVREFLQKYPKSIVVHLGCGLDSRFNRVDNGTVEWYDLDYPEVIELRKSFYQETDRYHLIPSSVMDLT